jgi:hypothetical protein
MLRFKQAASPREAKGIPQNLESSYSVSVAENTKQRIWKPQVLAEYARIKAAIDLGVRVAEVKKDEQ